jgi:hypothetical protein
MVICKCNIFSFNANIDFNLHCQPFLKNAGKLFLLTDFIIFASHRIRSVLLISEEINFYNHYF